MLRELFEFADHRCKQRNLILFPANREKNPPFISLRIRFLKDSSCHDSIRTDRMNQKRENFSRKNIRIADKIEHPLQFIRPWKSELNIADSDQFKNFGKSARQNSIRTEIISEKRLGFFPNFDPLILKILPQFLKCDFGAFLNGNFRFSLFSSGDSIKNLRFSFA